MKSIRRVTALLLSVGFTMGLSGYAQAATSVSVQAAIAAKSAWSEQMRRAFGFEDAALWEGGDLTVDKVKEGRGAIRWATHTVNKGLVCTVAPLDLSAFNQISFWLHSNHADGATFMVIAESLRKANVFSYYSTRVTVDWTGWKQVVLHFRAFDRTRGPTGWHKITRLRFTATGWNQEPTDESVWIMDALEFSYTTVPYHPRINVKKYLEEPDPQDFLDRLREGHPRLILLDENVPHLRAFIAENPRGQKWYAGIRRSAEVLAAKPVQTHRLPDGRRLLSISRDVLNRIYTWGIVYRLEGGKRWLDRAWEEMAAVAAFPDWNPNHYLDTAEMMHALAIGYDWFYPALGSEQRRVIGEALWQHGLRLSYAAYMGLEAEGRQGWKGSTNNWNFVCNGGTSMAAMALLDEKPKQCSKILSLAYQYIQIPIRHFEPDGAWWEGLGYWEYAMEYFVAYLRGLESSFGGDFGLLEALRGTGFERTGDFPVYLVSPLGSIYNFADSGTGNDTFRHPALFFLASRYQNPLYLNFQERVAAGTVQDLLYYEPFPNEFTVKDMALDRRFRQAEIATLRSSWTDRAALFVGIKCGKNGIAHAHQDLGSFVFYGLGERWFIDLGAERQTYLRHRHGLPVSQFYRIRAEGHNTLVLNPGAGFSQSDNGTARIDRFESSAVEAYAVADLSHAYRAHGVSVHRGFRLFGQRRALLIQDELSGKDPIDLWWFAHTGSRVAVSTSKSGREALLQKDGKKCQVSLLSPPEARFVVMDAKPLSTSPNPVIQNPNREMHKLGIHLPNVMKTTIAVLCVPHYNFEAPPLASQTVIPLASWTLTKASGPTLRSLSVLGTALPDFSPNVYTYTVRLGGTTLTLPRVSAEPRNQGAIVTIHQAESLPGRAVVRDYDATGKFETDYLVRFLFGGRDRK